MTFSLRRFLQEPSILFLLLLLTLASLTKNVDAKKGKVPKPTNITCYICADELSPYAKDGYPSCDGFRDLWRKFIVAKRKGKTSKTPYRNELLSQMKLTYGQMCQYGTEDCFYMRAFDERITGYEARGCGAGPTEVDAEAGEGCSQEQMSFGGGEPLDMINCVCEDSTNSNRGFCNKGVQRGGRRTIFGTLLGTTLLFIVIRPILLV